MLLLEPEQCGPDRQLDDERSVARARLAACVLRHLAQEGDCYSAVPGLSLHRRDAFCEPVCAFYEPSLSLVVQGRKRVLMGSEAYEYDAGRFMLTSVDLPTISQVLDGTKAKPFLSIMLKLDLAVVQEVRGEVDLHGLHGGGSGMMIGTVTADLLDAIVRLAALADAPKDIPVIGQLAVREIVYRLLVGPAGAQLRQIAMQGTRCNRIARAIAWLRENYAEPVRIEVLADMAAMGVSTFHHHFSAITKMSPLQYQKRIRLHEARRLLFTESLDASTVAFRVGYESGTQFSREYRRLFGNPPIRDISLLRSH